MVGNISIYSEFDDLLKILTIGNYIFDIENFQGLLLSRYLHSLLNQVTVL